MTVLFNCMSFNGNVVIVNDSWLKYISKWSSSKTVTEWRNEDTINSLGPGRCGSSFEIKFLLIIRKSSWHIRYEIVLMLLK